MIGGCDMPGFVKFIADFSHNLGLNRFHLVGHSFGGGIALHYALRFPHEIERLVLVNSMGLGKEVALWVRFLVFPGISAVPWGSCTRRTQGC